MNKILKAFFVYSNPLFWIYAIVSLIYLLLEHMLIISSISDWYFIYFKLDNIPKRHREDLLSSLEIVVNSKNFLQRRALKKAIEILKNK